LEKGELPLACAKRELIEEVGHQANEMIDLGLLYPAPGFCDEIQHCFLARELTTAAQELDEDELIEVEQLTVNELEEAILKGTLCDSKTIALLTRARLRHLL
jgi:ADP-ribose pyrophosphatase